MNCAHCHIYLSGYTVRLVGGSPQVWCVSCNQWANKLDIALDALFKISELDEKFVYQATGIAKGALKKLEDE